MFETQGGHTELNPSSEEEGFRFDLVLQKLDRDTFLTQDTAMGLPQGSWCLSCALVRLEYRSFCSRILA